MYQKLYKIVLFPPNLIILVLTGVEGHTSKILYSDLETELR